ncbi:MAG: hypothetical protein K2O16_19940 [Lachnospiraceae bacterium]|nr:hypothetical protein [Lachnospiraceae bacterium]
MESIFNPTEEMKRKFNITDEMLKYADNACLCPYCFGVFKPFTVTFRIAPESVCGAMRYETLMSEEKATAEPYRERRDTQYEEFWKRFPGSEPSDEESRAMVKRPVMHMLLPGHLRGQFVSDNEGFPIGMVDEKGNRSDARVCPHCHNRLPLNFGKYPVKYIALVGITSSGKTVYLSQLFKNLYMNLNDIGYIQVDGIDEVEEFCRANLIRKGKKLPAGNAPDKLTLPVAVTIQNKETREIHTLIFYDIAGENCVNSEQMKKYGPFIVNSDGIIMIVDPSQFPELLDGQEESEEEAAYPGKVIQAMYRAFVAAKSIKGQSDVPMAVALSKSDLLRPYFANRNRNSNIFRNINYKEYGRKGFPYNDYLNITMETRMLLEQERSGKAFVDAVKNGFGKSDFFAFSALNVKPVAKKEEENGSVYYIIEEDPEVLRIEEPFNWILYQLGMLEKVDKNKPEEALDRPKGRGLFRLLKNSK